MYQAFWEGSRSMGLSGACEIWHFSTEISTSKKGYLKYSLTQSFEIPSGKRLHNYGKIHHFQWVNPLFRLGHFPVRYVTNYQRVKESIQMWNSNEIRKSVAWWFQFGAYQLPFGFENFGRVAQTSMNKYPEKSHEKSHEISEYPSRYPLVN